MSERKEQKVEKKRSCEACQEDEENGVNPPLPPWAEGLRRPCALRQECPDRQPGEWESGTVITNDTSMLLFNALCDPACVYTLRLDGVEYTMDLNREDPNAAASANVNVEFSPDFDVEVQIVSDPAPSTSFPLGEVDDNLPSFFDCTSFSDDDLAPGGSESVDVD